MSGVDTPHPSSFPASKLVDIFSGVWHAGLGVDSPGAGRGVGGGCLLPLSPDPSPQAPYPFLEAEGDFYTVASNRLSRQIEFLIEADKLKRIVRQTLLVDGSRQEDSAEHSWHLAVLAMVLAEHASAPVDLFRVLKMILVHDLVEIDAGDTYCYDEEANRGKTEREKRAADRIFSLLPEDQAVEFRSLWEEFESRQTADAIFAASLDRLQPLLNNFRSGGLMWQRHGVRKDQVYMRNSPMGEGSQVLWEFAEKMIEDAIAKGWIGE
jgi:putative hydrolase of HD superfamily